MGQAETNRRVRAATVDDAAAIAEIYNQGIFDRIATFETEARSPEERARWLTEREPRHVVLIAEQDSQAAGWAALSPYSSRPCYRGVAEYSIYIERGWRGQGVGSFLMQALIDAAEREGFWKLTSRIFTFNEGSRRLHRRLGFREVGINEKHAQLDGTWLDTVTIERLIETNIR